MKGFVHSFESFGTVDGPGVRFVVFLQGCPMRCLYCHNPDTWELGAGTAYEPQEVLEKMTRNLPFYKTGGLTVSGGEPLLQIDFLIELFSLARKRGIHTALDTSGITFNPQNTEKIDTLLCLCDLVMLDIKHADDIKHKELCSHSNKNIIEFARHISRHKIPLRIRHVLVPGYTDSEESLLKLAELLRELDSLERLEILPYHNLGEVKYERLGLVYPLKGLVPPTSEDVLRAYKIVNKHLN